MTLIIFMHPGAPSSHISGLTAEQNLILGGLKINQLFSVKAVSVR